MGIRVWAIPGKVLSLINTSLGTISANISLIYEVVNSWHTVTSESKILVTIEDPEGKIHDHASFVLADAVRTIAAAGRTDVILLRIGAASEVHLTFFAITPKEDYIDVQLYENPTISNNGTTANAINRNRDPGIGPAAAVYTLPTTSAPGTLLYSERHMAGAQNADKCRREHMEFILKRSRNYLLAINNVTAADSAEVQLIINFYEAKP